MNHANPKLTIVMTDRAPVRFVKADWPLIAHGAHSSHDGEIECQANERLSVNIRVRRREDGQTLVYGAYEFSTQWAGRGNVIRHAGHLYEEEMAPESLVRAICRVGEEISGGDPSDPVAEAVNECIADLPAVAL